MADSTIGAELFFPELTKWELKLFLDIINKRIFNLDYHNFDPVEVQGFQRLMMHSASNSDSDLLAEFDKCETEISFCSSELGKKWTA